MTAPDPDLIPESGVWVNRRGDSFQFFAGHNLAPGALVADGWRKISEVRIPLPSMDRIIAAGALKDHPELQ